MACASLRSWRKTPGAGDSGKETMQLQILAAKLPLWQAGSAEMGRTGCRWNEGTAQTAGVLPVSMHPLTTFTGRVCIQQGESREVT